MAVAPSDRERPVVDEVPEIVPTRLRQGKSHSLAFRERIAIAVHAAKVGKKPLADVARNFSVDRKTAYRYFKWWERDRENGIRYSNPEDLKRSLLNPLTWKKKDERTKTWEVRPRDWVEKRFGRDGDANPGRTWKTLSKLLVDLQVNHVPQYTAHDIVYAVEKVRPKRATGQGARPRTAPLTLRSYAPEDEPEDAPARLQYHRDHEGRAPRVSRDGARGGTALAVGFPKETDRRISDRAPDQVEIFPFMRDSVRKSILKVKEFLNERRIVLTEADVERARKDYNLSYKTIAYDHQEKDLQSVLKEKRVFREVQSTLYAEDCVFVDEFHVVMNLAPQKGWTLPGKHAPLRKIDQRYTKTTVLAAMRWPSRERDDKPRVAFYLRILPPLPLRITNQNPCNTASEREVADVLRGQIWWEGIMMLVGGYIALFDPVPFHDIGLYKLRARLARDAPGPRGTRPRRPQELGFSPLPLRADLRKVILDGDYDGVLRPPRGAAGVEAVSHQSGFLPEIRQLWTRRGPKEADMRVDVVRMRPMRLTFWEFLPNWDGRADGNAPKTVADFLSSISTLPTPDDKAEFVVRLAAHDFVMFEYIKRHNYPIKDRIFGDEIRDAKNVREVLPPGVNFKNVTPLFSRGNDDIKVAGMLKETEEEARRAMLAYPETGSTQTRTGVDDDDQKSGTKLMVDKLVRSFRNSSFREILNALFFDDDDPAHRELDQFFSSDADDSFMFDRDYVNAKIRSSGAAENDPVRRANLARAIYRALSVHWTVSKGSMTPLDVATHVWFIVHHCKGRDTWVDGKLDEMGPEYSYGDPPRIDPDFRGSELAKDVLKGFRTFTRVGRNRVLPIVIAPRHFSDKYAGAPPLPVTKTVFRWFLESMPDGFVEGKTVVMDGASYHAKPTNEQKQRNDALPPHVRIFPDGEMSEFALLLRKRGAGDSLLHPPTLDTYRDRKIALLYLSPFSPELNPIELAFNTAKHFIRRESARVGRTRLNLSYVIINAFHALIRPHAIKNYMLCSGYRSVEKNVVPVPVKEQPIEEVDPVVAADVLLPVRRGCMAQFVDGKYEDPSKKKKREAGVARPVEYRDYTRLIPYEESYRYPGKRDRRGMDFRVPLLRTCDTEKNNREGYTRDGGWVLDDRTGAKVVLCKRKRASEYEPGERVEVKLDRERDEWVDATVWRAPAPRGGARPVHDPWIEVSLPGDPGTRHVTVNRVRAREEDRVRAADAARRAADENEAERKALVAMRRRDRQQRARDTVELRRKLWRADEERRDKFVLEVMRGSADPLAMLRASDGAVAAVEPLTERERDVLPAAYTRLVDGF